MPTQSRTLKTRIRYKLFKSDVEPIICIMLILLALGTINVFSSSYVLAGTDFGDPFFFLERHLLWLVIGGAACLICSHMNYTRWRGLIFIALVIMIVLLIGVLVAGVTINGARRWISLGGMSFQPSEFAKLIAILLAAFAISSTLKDKRHSFHRLTVPFGCILLMAILVAIEPDFGTACIILGVPLIMALIMLVQPRGWLPLGGIGAIIAFAYAFSAEYRRERLLVMFDPWSDALGAGYQVVQSIATIGSGELFGMGFGSGVSKYDYLPEAHTDFAFAIVSQEHGFLGVLFIFGLLIALALFCARVAGKAEDTFGQVLALGIILLLFGQAIVNLAMVAGLFAVVGVPLPFISYGGSSMVATLMAMGILISIATGGKLTVRKTFANLLISLHIIKSRPPRPSAGMVANPAPDSPHPHLRRIK